MKLVRWLSVLGVMLAMVAAAVAVPSVARAQTAFVEPGAGLSGTEFSFFADSFDPRERVSLWLNAPNGDILVVVDDDDNVEFTSANGAGEATWSFEFVDLSPGVYEMVAEGDRSGLQYVIPFEILAPQPGDGGLVEPSSGPAGETIFQFSAVGYEPREEVAIWVNAPDGSAVPVIDLDEDDEERPLRVAASGEGVVEFVIVLPADAPPGVYAAVAEGLSSSLVRVIPFEVTGP